MYVAGSTKPTTLDPYTSTTTSSTSTNEYGEYGDEDEDARVTFHSDTLSTRFSTPDTLLVSVVQLDLLTLPPTV